MDQNHAPHGYDPHGPAAGANADSEPKAAPSPAEPVALGSPSSPPEQPYQYQYVPPPSRQARRRSRAPMLVAWVCLIVAFAVLIGLAVLYFVDTGNIPWIKAAATAAGESAPTFDIYDLPENADDGLSTVEIAQKVGPSVVCINIYVPQSLAVAGSGSGIIMNDEGYIVTNAHVVDGASTISVMLEDGREYKAKLIGTDSRTDLAVVKIDATDLVPAEFGDSDQLQVGERVIAIGNAAGELAGSVTQGIISGLNRTITIETSNGESIRLMLVQTDAAINPGNSGGALVNRFGQVIGINSAKLNNTMYEGLGFAIPTARVKPIVENLIAYGYVKDRGVLGASLIALSPVTAPNNDLPEHGLYISAIEDYSDLPNHGVVVGDIILQADGQDMTSVNDLADLILQHSAGETLELKIQKQGSGDIVTIYPVLVTAPES